MTEVTWIRTVYVLYMGSKEYIWNTGRVIVAIVLIAVILSHFFAEFSEIRFLEDMMGAVLLILIPTGAGFVLYVLIKDK